MNNTNITYYNSINDSKTNEFVAYATMYLSVEQIDKAIQMLAQTKVAKERQNKILSSACNYPMYY